MTPKRKERVEEDEPTLLARVAAKDRRAFEALYQRYYSRLFSYLFKITRRPEMVEELVNDVMLVVWEKAAKYDGVSKPSSWILGIAYRKALKALERAGRRQREGLGGPPPTPPEGPERLMVRREMASTLGRALAGLSAEQRAVVELTYYFGYSYPEIAEIISCPVNTVKTRMFYALRRLRDAVPELKDSFRNQGATPL